MNEAKTVSSSLDLFVRQCNDVNDMRNTLLSFNRTDPGAARKALQNVTVLRVYHQIARIVRYTEVMDKIEDKMYQSIDSQLDCLDADDPESWRLLINLQERLQENMIQSHRLLEPYLNFESLSFTEVASESEAVDSSATILDKDSREKLRNSAQEVLKALQQSAQQNQQIIRDDVKEEIHEEPHLGINSRFQPGFKDNGLCPPSL